MHADENLMCDIDTESKHIEVSCPTRGNKIAIHAIVFSIAGQVVSAMGFNFKGDASTGCETLKKYLSGHFMKLYDAQGQQIPDIDLTEYKWDVQPIPTARCDERAEMVLRG